MANAIQKFAANTTCCLATNIKKTDDKLKYGSEDMLCCINKDFMAAVFSELLMCNPISTDTTWTAISFDALWTQNSPPVSLPGTFDIIGDGVLVSYDGLLTVSVPIGGTYTAIDMIDVNRQFADVTCQTAASGIYISCTAFNETTGVASFLLVYSEEWGSATEIPDRTRLGSNNNPFDGSSFNVVISSYNPTTDECLTADQLCSIKNWLDKYCQSC